MTSSNSTTPSLIINISLWLLLLFASLFPLSSSLPANSTFRPSRELLKYRRVRAHLKRLNKPPLKTIQAFSPTPSSSSFLFSVWGESMTWLLSNLLQSPDGDLIDCVPSHLQSAFDHPRLKGQKPLVLLRKFSMLISTECSASCLCSKLVSLLSMQDPPERPRGYGNNDDEMIERYQLWRSSGESCPEGTVAIRRTREEEVLRASSIKRFGRKPVRRDSESGGHEVRHECNFFQWAQDLRRDG